MVNTWISIAILEPLAEFLNPVYFIYLYNCRRLKKRIVNGHYYSKKQANLLFEPPKVNLPKEYAEILLLLFYTAFYIPLFPLGVGITLLGMLTHYISDKYLMIARHRRPEKISQKLTACCMSLSLFSIPILIVILLYIYIYIVFN